MKEAKKKKPKIIILDKEEIEEKLRTGEYVLSTPKKRIVELEE